MNCEEIFWCLKPNDLIVLLAGFLLSILWALLLYSLRPNLLIDGLIHKKKTGEKPMEYLRVELINRSKCFDAVNIRIEVCVLVGDRTFHFELDRQDFIILPKKECRTEGRENVRTFQAFDITESTKMHGIDFAGVLNQSIRDDAVVRVRAHAYHTFSGFGKAFEARFHMSENGYVKV